MKVVMNIPGLKQGAVIDTKDKDLYHLYVLVDLHPGFAKVWTCYDGRIHKNRPITDCVSLGDDGIFANISNDGAIVFDRIYFVDDTIINNNFFDIEDREKIPRVLFKLDTASTDIVEESVFKFRGESYSTFQQARYARSYYELNKIFDRVTIKKMIENRELVLDHVNGLR